MVVVFLIFEEPQLLILVTLTTMYVQLTSKSTLDAPISLSPEIYKDMNLQRRETCLSFYPLCIPVLGIQLLLNRFLFKRLCLLGVSLVAQWLRILLPMQGTRVQALARKILHATEQLSPCTTTTESELQSPRATTTEAHAPRTRAPQQEKPPE